MEYSVVYTDRAMNHMSAPFQEVMQLCRNQISGTQFTG